MDKINIVKAYVAHSGSFEFDNRKFSAFVNDFPDLLNNYPRIQLAHMIKAELPKVAEEMDPIVNTDDLKSLIITTDNESDIFLNTIKNKRLSQAVREFQNFPFYNKNNKIRIKNAILAVYGADLANSGNDALGNIPEPPLAETPAPAPKAPETNPTDRGKTKAEETSEESPQKALDPKLEEDAVFTIEKYLQKYIFNSKLIPIVKIVKAFEVKNGYVIEIEFSSPDGKTKAFAKAVIHNNKLVPPAELEDENENKIGDFNSETFLKLFSVEKGRPKTDNYNDLMDQMVSAPDYVQAGLILQKIAKKFGPEIANNALDSFIRIRTKRDKKIILGSPSRLGVKIE